MEWGETNVGLANAQIAGAPTTGANIAANGRGKNKVKSTISRCADLTRSPNHTRAHIMHRDKVSKICAPFKAYLN
jgi:hypothetical protein